MEILLIITYTVFFIFLIQKLHFFEVEGISKNSISLVFILKIIAGFILWAIYSFYYTGRVTADIFKYFDDSKIMFDSLKTKPIHFFKMFTGIGNETATFTPYYDEMNFWQKETYAGIYNNNHLLIRFNAFLRFFSLGFYNVHTVFMCFISLIGLTAIYKTFQPILKEKSRELFFIVFLLPSVLFWGSGVLKEGLIIFAMGLLIYNCQRLFNSKAILISVIAGSLLFVAKFYVWIAIVPGLLFLLWVNKSNTSMLFLKFITIVSLTFLTGLNIHKFTSMQNPLNTLSQKQNEFNLLASGSITDAQNKQIAIPKSAIQINTLAPTFSSLLKNSPQAISNTLLRPFIWEIKSPMMLLAGLENILIIAFIILCIAFRKPFKEIRWEHFLFCISFALILFLIIGLTTPIIGAIARYKVPALPFFLISFLLILDKEKIKKCIPIYSKIFK